MLPDSSNTIYTGATPVKSADLDDIQNCITGMKFKPHWRWFGFPRAGRETNIAFDTSGGLWVGSLRATANAAFYDGGFIPNLPEGTVISGLKAQVSGTGAAQHVHLRLWNNGGVIGDLDVNALAVGFATYTLDPIGTITTLAPGDLITVSADLPLLATEILRFAIKVSRP